MKIFTNILPVGVIALALLGFSLLSLSMISEVDQIPSSSIQVAANNSSYYKLLDDFNTGTERPCYSGNEGLIESPCPIENGYVKMNYDVTKFITSYAFLPTELQGMNLSNWDSVWFVIRGEDGGEELDAEFATEFTTDCNYGDWIFAKEAISDYLNGGITTTWRAAAIPLSAFPEIPNWSCLSRFSIVAAGSLPSPSGKVYLDQIRLLGSKVLIDDFPDHNFENELGGESGIWTDTATVSITPTFINNRLNLSYNVPPGDVGGGYWISLISTNLLSQKDYLLFDVWGEQGGEEILVEFTDCGLNGYTHQPKIKISDYLEGGITTDRRTVVIPLAAFTEVTTDTDEGVNWKCINVLAFNVSGKPQYYGGQGTVHIDNVKLVSANTGSYRLPILIDHFNDCNDWSALNAEWITGTITQGAPIVFTATHDTENRRGNYGCGYRLTHDIDLNQSAWIHTDLRGLDVHNYEYLEFYLKGKEGTDCTNVFNVYLEDRDVQTEMFKVEKLATNTWQEVRIPLSDFSSNNVDLTDLKVLKFAFEGGIRRGEIYVDEIKFVIPFSVTLPIIFKQYPPTELYVFNNYTGGNVNFKVYGTTVDCNIPNGETKYCGSFPPGTYTVEATASCGTTVIQITFIGGPQTKTVSC